MSFAQDFKHTFIQTLKSPLKYNNGIVSFQIGLNYFEDNQTVDQRLAKIDKARVNLSEALTAIQEIETESIKSSAKLEKLSKKIEEAKEHKSQIETKNTDLANIAKVSEDGIRKTFGIVSPGMIWAQRVFGFGFGVIASILGALILQYGPDVLDQINSISTPPK